VVQPPPVPTAGLSLIAGNTSGPGTADGAGSAARFAGPKNLALDGAGNLYVGDCLGGIRKITPAGVVTTIAGSAIRGTSDGMGTAAQFNCAYGIALAVDGTLYVSDFNASTIRIVTQNGTVMTVAGVTGLGALDGPLATARFNRPHAVAFDSAGKLYVADDGNKTIRKIDLVTASVTTFAGAAGQAGNVDGPAASARFNGPSGLAFDKAGTLYVADRGTIRAISPAGVVTTIAGMAASYGSADGAGSAARFSDIMRGMATDAAGNVYLADFSNQVVRKISPAGVVSTYAGQAGVAGSIDGDRLSARFLGPAGVVVNAAGDLFVADSNNTIRKIDAAGKVTTIAGAPTVTGSADGTGAGALFNGVSSSTIDSNGTLYVVDSFGTTIRKITRAGVVTTVAGQAGVSQNIGGVSGTARFVSISGIVADQAGNLFVTDDQTIREVSAAGMVFTLARPITALPSCYSETSSLSGIVRDAAGNFYVADSALNAIFKVSAGGAINVVAGGIGCGDPGLVDGNGNLAQFNMPTALALDLAGNVYVADMGNNKIRKVTPAGQVTTLAGNFDSPTALQIDGAGNLYVYEAGTFLIRKVTPAGVVTTVAGLAGQLGTQLGSLPGRLGFVGGMSFIDGNTMAITVDNGVIKLILQ
jgi:sugar lactone lactonase YvrE